MGDCFVQLTALCLLGAVLTAACQRTEETSPGTTLPGVVVEDVREGSTLATAGIQPGDVLLSWRRLPDPEDSGEIGSVFDWWWLTIEQSPRGSLRLTGQRDGHDVYFIVPPGPWDAEVRPVMPESTLEIYTQGRQQARAGELVAAAESWQELTRRPEIGTDWRLRSWLFLESGKAWRRARQREHALAAFRSALEEARDPLSQVRILDDLGRLAFEMDDLDAATDAFERGVKIARELAPESLLAAASLNSLGIAAKQRGDLERASEHHQEALELRRRLAPDSPLVAASLGNLGVTALVRGDLKAAADGFEQALEAFAKLAPGSLAVANCLSNLGVVAEERGDLDQADEYYRQSLEIEEKLAPDSLSMASTLNNLGVVAKGRGDLDRAVDYHEQALRIRQTLAPAGLAVADSLNNLGIVARESGDLETASRHHRQALDIQRKLAPDGLGAAHSLGNLGIVAKRRGDLDAAAEYYDRSLEIVSKLAPGSLAVASNLKNLAIVAEKRGDLEHAAGYGEQALAIFERLAPDSRDAADTLHGLGTLARRQDRPGPALDFFMRALAAFESQVARLGASRGVEAAFRADYRDYYAAAIELLLELERPGDAFDVLERSRAQSFLAQLTERDLSISDEIPAKWDDARRRLAKRYEATQQEIARLDPDADETEIAALVSRLRRLRDEYDDVVERIRRASPRLASLRYPRPLELAQAAAALNQGTVLLSYSVGEERTHLFVVTGAGGLSVETLDVGAEDLRHEVEFFRDLIAKAPAGESADSDLKILLQSARRLYAALIEPAAARIAESDRILVVADGPLHLLPFGALVRETDSPRGWEYLVEWKPVHSVLSATVYAELRKTRRRPGDRDEVPVLLAAFGDPHYPRRLSRERSGEIADVHVRSAADRGGFDVFDWKSLPHTRREVVGIAGLYGSRSVRTYLGEEATEERLKSLGRGPRIVHVAAHGHYDERFPLSSFVALSIPEEPGEDRDNGLLQAWEIFEGVRLDADLVVLSGCRTGVGQEVGGEGLIGLTRAFQYAGARSVIASLWNVADRATAELMVRFYRHLRAGRPMDAALRAAQTELIRGPIRVEDDGGAPVAKDASAPFYWAAFQLYGDWESSIAISSAYSPSSTDSASRRP